MNLADIKEASGDAKIYVGRSTTVQMHKLRNQNISADNEVPRSVVNNYCVLCTVKAKQREAETHTTKNFVEFHNYPPLLTMV